MRLLWIQPQLQLICMDLTAPQKGFASLKMKKDLNCQSTKVRGKQFFFLHMHGNSWLSLYPLVTPTTCRYIDYAHFTVHCKLWKGQMPMVHCSWGECLFIRLLLFDNQNDVRRHCWVQSYLILVLEKSYFPLPIFSISFPPPHFPLSPRLPPPCQCWLPPPDMRWYWYDERACPGKQSTPTPELFIG